MDEDEKKKKRKVPVDDLLRDVGPLSTAHVQKTGDVISPKVERELAVDESSIAPLAPFVPKKIRPDREFVPTTPPTEDEPFPLGSDVKALSEQVKPEGVGELDPRTPDIVAQFMESDEGKEELSQKTGVPVEEVKKTVEQAKAGEDPKSEREQQNADLIAKAIEGIAAPFAAYLIGGSEAGAATAASVLERQKAEKKTSTELSPKRYALELKKIDSAQNYRDAAMSLEQAKAKAEIQFRYDMTQTKSEEERERLAQKAAEAAANFEINIKKLENQAKQHEASLKAEITKNQVQADIAKEANDINRTRYANDAEATKARDDLNARLDVLKIQLTAAGLNTEVQKLELERDKLNETIRNNTLKNAVDRANIGKGGKGGKPSKPSPSVPGYALEEGASLSAAEASKMKDAIYYTNDSIRLINEMKSLYMKYGTKVLPGSAKQQLKTTRQRLLANFKTIDNLGVLQQWDLAFLNQALPNPTSISTIAEVETAKALGDGDPVIAAFDTVLSDITGKLKLNTESRGLTPVSPQKSTAPPGGGLQKPSGKSLMTPEQRAKALKLLNELEGK